MEFNQLESFLSVVKHKSFSKAAKELYLTQPTVSNNIQNLERELKIVLLDRKSKTVTLTDAGKEFYRYALELINTRDKAKHIMMEKSESIEGEISINASSIPEQYILPYIIKGFVKKYPKVTFTVTHKNSKDVVEEILKGKNNFGIVGAKYASEVLEYIDFFQDELVLAVPNNENYHWASDTVDMDSLLSSKFIFRKKGSGTRLIVEKGLSDIGIHLDNLNITSFIDSNEMIKKMIELELGISLISKIAVKNEMDLGLIKTYRVKSLELNRSFYFVYHKHRTLSPVVDAFRDFLINWTGPKLD
ncbi:MAG: LysR family transcriptional regulator [Dethiosulfatibacter sp.]|nr:LysR family transcriptional regulator [Dethiosulfatibacter sp.]